MLLGTVLYPGPAIADELRATRQQPLSERSHVVELRIRDGIATYRVRRVFRNASSARADEARLTIRLPHGAAATGLRIKAGERWYEGELMHARRAEELYRELTGMGPSQPKDPALLAWRWTDELSLRVFPILPGKTSTVEYTLTAPTSYRDGVHYVSYPRAKAGQVLATPVLRVVGDRLSGPVTVDGEPLRGRRAVLGKREPHPLLAHHSGFGERTLVRALPVQHDVQAERVALAVDFQHTWPGDLELGLVDPDGTLHRVREHDLSRRDNGLRETFVVDRSGALRGTWHLLVRDHHPLDGGTLRSWSIAPALPGTKARAGAPAFWDRRPSFVPQPTESEAGVAVVGVRLRDNERQTHVRVGRVALLPDAQFTRLEVDIGRRLSQLPRKHSVVFVVDASHSMGPGGIQAQLQLVAAYLSHVPRARFALIAVRRRVEQWSGFTPAAQLDATLESLQARGRLEPNNGSFLDRGLRKAAALVGGVGGSTAVVLLTDDRLRPSWHLPSAVALADTLPQQTVLHVVDASGQDEPALERDDEHRLFPLAKVRGGVTVRGYGLAGKPSALARAVRYLVRPDRLDHPVIPGLPRDPVLQEELQEPLLEGSSLRWMGRVAQAPVSVTLRGQLWSKAVAFTTQPSEPFHRATAAYVFSLDHYSDLAPEQQFVIASYGRCVSPVTSYLAIEPGVRPSVIGLEGEGFGSGGLGMRARGARSHFIGPAVDWKAVVARARDRCRAHRLRGVALVVDTTGAEIVDVRLQTAVTDPGRCLVEALWQEQLPQDTRGDESKLLTF